MYAYTMTPGKTLVDQVVYTASLASSPTDIDEPLDTLRKITAREDHALSQADVAKLNSLQNELEDYLVTRERLRFFTPESLRVQIDQYMQGYVNGKSRILLLMVVGAAIFLAVGAASLPLSNIPQRVQAGGATAFSAITVGAAWLFLMALPAFRSRLRQAFVVICTGMILLGLSLLEQPIIEIFELREVSSLLYPIPILVAATLFHIGNAMYVRLAGVKTVLTKAWPVVLLCFVASVVTFFLPHPPSVETELTYDLAAAIWVCILIMPVVSAIILAKTAKSLPELYKVPINRLFQAMIPIVVVCAYQYVVRIVAGPYMDGVVAYILFSLILVMALGLLRAGYAFNKIIRY